jgi:hypothetical protein
MRFKGVSYAPPVAFLSTVILWLYRLVAKIVLALATVALRMTVLLPIVVWAIATDTYQTHISVDRKRDRT